MSTRRDRSKMTPRQKQWDTINNPSVSQTELTFPQRQRLFYRMLFQLGFARPFAEGNAQRCGMHAEFMAARAAMRLLLVQLDEQIDDNET